MLVIWDGSAYGLLIRCEKRWNCGDLGLIKIWTGGHVCQKSWYSGAFKDRSELAQLGGCENNWHSYGCEWIRVRMDDANRKSWYESKCRWKSEQSASHTVVNYFSNLKLYMTG